MGRGHPTPAIPRASVLVPVPGSRQEPAGQAHISESFWKFGIFRFSAGLGAGFSEALARMDLDSLAVSQSSLTQGTVISHLFTRSVERWEGWGGVDCPGLSALLFPSPPALQVPGQTDQLHLQPGGAEEAVHEPHQPAASVPFPDGEGLLRVRPALGAPGLGLELGSSEGGWAWSSDPQVRVHFHGLGFLVLLPFSLLEWVLRGASSGCPSHTTQVLARRRGPL